MERSVPPSSAANGGRIGKLPCRGGRRARASAGARNAKPVARRKTMLAWPGAGRANEPKTVPTLLGDAIISHDRSENQP